MVEKAKINLGRLVLLLGLIGYWAAVCILVHPYARADLSEPMRWFGAFVLGTIAAIICAIVIFALFAACLLLPAGLRKLKDWLYDR
jgi:hypothetical protein